MKETGALKGRLVTVFHAADLTSFVRREGGAVYSDLFRDGDLFLPVSTRAQELLLGLGCPLKRIRLHRMGVELEKFAYVPRQIEAGVPLKILSVARLVDKKGIVYALGAVAQLARDGVAVDYTIVGDGPLRVELEALALEQGIGACVHFTGALDEAGVRVHLGQAQILLAPSIVAGNADEEGVPVVVMEAMASGVAVITTLTGGIRDLVIDDDTGFIVAPKDSAALARKVLWLAHHPVETSQVTARARARVEARHSADIQNRELDRILSSLSMAASVSTAEPVT
jgi:colanic acid/amylovoran biosynthesis glycosyltransferase